MSETEASRKAEIDRKKGKLEELRKQRQKRQQNQAVAAATPSKGPSGALYQEEIFRDVDALIKQAMKLVHYENKPQQQAKEQPIVQPKPTTVIPERIDRSKPPVDTYNREVQTDPVTLGVNSNDIPTIQKEESDITKQVMIKRPEPEEEIKESELTMKEKKDLLEAPEFTQFVNRSSLLMERILDFNTNYGKDKTGQKLSLISTFEDEITSNRPCTDIGWSPKYEELVLSSYAENEDALSDDAAEGSVLVWNQYLQSRPEYQFLTQSSVLRACFHPTKPKLIIGTTYNGEIVTWDMREKQTPVNRTSLSHGHTYPVYGLKTCPSVQDTYNILSLSTDAKLCVWSDVILEKPTHEIDFRLPKKADGKQTEITTSCFSYPGRDTNNIVLGSDEGALYRAHIYENPGIYRTIKAHDGPITGVTYHPATNCSNPKLVSDLFLTSSFDWSCKLWSDKVSVPLYTFENSRDYIYTVRWSPSHPALFAVGDGTGMIELWDLGKDVEIPQVRLTVKENRAITFLQWSRDGRKLSCGDSNGSLYIYSLDEEIANPTTEGTTAFYERIHKARKTAMTNPEAVLIS